MGSKTQKQVGPRFGQGEQNPNLDPNPSLSLAFLLSLSLSLSLYLLMYVCLNIVSFRVRITLNPLRNAYLFLSNLRG